jgi:hypothetical protein
VYAVVEVGVTETVPDVPVPTPEQDVALTLDQVSVALLPATMDPGLAARDTLGGGGGGEPAEIVVVTTALGALSPEEDSATTRKCHVPTASVNV